MPARDEDDWDETKYLNRTDRAETARAAWTEAQTAADPAFNAHLQFDGGFKLHRHVSDRLYPYQRTAVNWLWELHCQRAGGIVGDEMGLGKTIQVAAFLGGLVQSDLYAPSLVVCPATVLKHWLRELREWAPELRVVLLHDSVRGSSTRYDHGAAGKKTKVQRPNKAQLLEDCLKDPK